MSEARLDVALGQRRSQYLTFQLGSDTQAMLPVEHLTEVLTLAPNQIVPISDMAAWVLGIYNWRGEILWVVDLAQVLGLSPLWGQVALSQYAVVIVQINGLRLGLAVSQVRDMFWCDPDQVESAPALAVTPALAPVLRGITLSAQNDMLLALDVAAIFDRLSA